MVNMMVNMMDSNGSWLVMVNMMANKLVNKWVMSW